MKTYISILRGINVSGQKLIKMDALRTAYENIGIRNVTTYVQSGNVIFDALETDPEKLEKMIYSRIEKDFGFEVPVMVLTVEKLKQVVDNNPFGYDRDKDPAFLHVTFLSSKPGKYDSSAIEEKKQEGEEILFTDEAVYLYCPNGYGRTKLNNNFLEARLKVTATTRNWKTANELLKMALDPTRQKLQ
ncbi:MAG TPA: DUF1697 domain-containing protein [Draconibacterium sp.]|nr:DUF1697 domain-containing protein [Draconibacterium sp.]